MTGEVWSINSTQKSQKVEIRHFFVSMNEYRSCELWRQKPIFTVPIFPIQIQKCFSVTSSTPTWYKILACQQLKMKMKLKFEFSTLRCLPMIWIMKEAKTTAQPQPPSGGGTDWDEEELCCWADSDQSEISIYCVNQSEISIYCVNQSDIISFYVNQ